MKRGMVILLSYTLGMHLYTKINEHTHRHTWGGGEKGGRKGREGEGERGQEGKWKGERERERGKGMVGAVNLACGSEGFREFQGHRLSIS